MGKKLNLEKSIENYVEHLFNKNNDENHKEVLESSVVEEKSNIQYTSVPEFGDDSVKFAKGIDIVLDMIKGYEVYDDA